MSVCKAFSSVHISGNIQNVLSIGLVYMPRQDIGSTYKNNRFVQFCNMFLFEQFFPTLLPSEIASLRYILLTNVYAMCHSHTVHTHPNTVTCLQRNALFTILCIYCKAYMDVKGQVA